MPRSRFGGGLADCVIALGFEKMQPGSLGGGADDRESPLGRHVKALAEIDEFAFPVAPGCSVRPGAST